MAPHHTYNRPLPHKLLVSVAASPAALGELGLQLQESFVQSKRMTIIVGGVASALGMEGLPLMAGDVGAAALHLLGFRVSADGSLALLPGGLLMRERSLQLQLATTQQLLSDSASLLPISVVALQQELMETSAVARQREQQLHAAVEAGQLLQRQCQSLEADLQREKGAAPVNMLHLQNLEKENKQLKEQLATVKDARDLHRGEKHKALRQEHRAHDSRDTLRSKGIWLSADTDSRFRALLEKEPRPQQVHLAKLIDAQLRAAESKSGRCKWPREILQWYTIYHSVMHMHMSTSTLFPITVV